MTVKQMNRELGLLGVGDIQAVRKRVENVVRRKMPNLHHYAIEDAVSTAIVDHLEKLDKGEYKPPKTTPIELELVVAAISRATDEVRKDPMSRMKKKARQQINKAFEEGQHDPIRPKQRDVPPGEFFDEYAATKLEECRIEKEDLRESLQGLMLEIFDVLPGGSRSVLRNYFNLLDCSQGEVVTLEDVSKVCGMTPSGVHNAVKRAQGKLTRQHLELVDSYKTITTDRVTTFVTTL